jgi:hypothetical protein
VSGGLQLFKTGDERGILAFALAAFCFNGFENGAQAVQQLEQAGDDGAVGGQFAFAQLAKQVFAGVGQLLEPLEAKEAGGSLDGVHRTEDIADQARILGALFQIGEATLHAVQTFLALDQELPCQFIHCVHSSGRPE